MTELKLDISVSLDGYVAGPDVPTLEDPLGSRGEELHEWVFSAAAWREAHGREGGETGVDSELVAAHVESVGATIMGRKMFSGGSGDWADDPNATGWWGDEPPFHHPVFVLTHHEREPLELTGTTFHFVTDGIQPALDQAREAAGDKAIAIAGGAAAAQQYLNAGLVSQVCLHITPVIFGSGVSLLADINPSLRWEQTGAVEGNGVTHVTYRIS